MKRYLYNLVMVLFCLFMLTGCGNKRDIETVDMSLTETEMYSFSVSDEVQIIGLGEASHGVKEYQQMKGEVFKALVSNNDCKAFIIEGDFGGALKVNEYIHGGDGTAEEVVSEIGFAIYKTQEMADLIQWMRDYNENVPKEKKINFYGMDMQRFDNNKEILFRVLQQAAPELCSKYEEKFAQLTDENRVLLSSDILKEGKINAQSLLDEMDAMETDIVKIAGQESFAYARQCLTTIYECCELLLCSDAEYNSLRDGYMAEKVKWFVNFGNDEVLFISGHNGHIGKTSVAGYKCLGQLLAEEFGDRYYAIGTDAEITNFNSQDENGNFSVMDVSNENELTAQADGMENVYYFVDFSSVTNDGRWQEIVSNKQRITTLNVGISEMQAAMKAMYTTTIIPQNTFDGMIIYKEVTPTTLLGDR